MPPTSAFLVPCLVAVLIGVPGSFARAQDGAPAPAESPQPVLDGDASVDVDGDVDGEQTAPAGSPRAQFIGLMREGFTRNAPLAVRQKAIDAIASLEDGEMLAFATKYLAGGGANPNRIARDREVRATLFTRLAEDADFGQPLLVKIAVSAREDLRASAGDALPDRLSREAEAELRGYLAGDRELFINRAAGIASAHEATALIPALVEAQVSEPRVKRGDEAWIALGKSVSYIRGLQPVVGDASGAFQPIPGVLFEGSVFRVMESTVTIYRTEVHTSLAGLVERETGEPAPPFGYDQARWRSWLRYDFPKLAAAHRDKAEVEDRERGVKTTAPLSDG